MRCSIAILTFAALLSAGFAAHGQTAQPTATPATRPANLPFLEVDIPHRTVRMECQAVKADYALEFYCVKEGTNEYEAILSSKATPSHLHMALLMLGLKAGHDFRYSQEKDAMLPPDGPPLRLSVEWTKDGKLVRYPAYRLMRNLKTKQEAPPMIWVFAGSRETSAGRYQADLSGYLVSVTNVEGMVIDQQQRVSNTMEERQWEPNSDLMPEPGTKVWLVIEPEAVASAPATKP
jgi:hypothetical protein